MTEQDAASLDQLIARLRERAADPARRADAIPSVFMTGVRSLSLDQLRGEVRDARADLDRVVAANREGRIDPELHARAERIAEAMKTPAPSELPARASAETIERAEAELGRALPIALRRVYTEVADGGFGPGPGLLPLARAVALHRELRSHAPGPRGQSWPDGLLPLVEQDPGLDCVETVTGRVIAWDPEELTERSGAGDWQRSFREIAPSVQAWLGEWVVSRPLEERIAEQAQASMIEMARQSRARIAAMTPQERAAMGLPEVGWERIVWGGLGLDDEPPG